MFTLAKNIFKNFKNLQTLDIWYEASSYGPLPSLFKLQHKDQKWPKLSGSGKQLCHLILVCSGKQLCHLLIIIANSLDWQKVDPDLFLIQAIWCTDSVPERFLFENMSILKNRLQITIKAWKLPSMHRVNFSFPGFNLKGLFPPLS